MMGGVNREQWEAVLEDATAFAEEYREAGWDVVAVESGTVSPAEKDERFGMSVLLPGSQYEEVEAVVERSDVAFDGADVYTNSLGDTVYTIVIERDDSSQTAVIIPLAYAISDLVNVFERALETGTLEIHLRPLSIENWVTFAHDEPTLFFDEERVKGIIENDPRRKMREKLQEGDGDEDAKGAEGSPAEVEKGAESPDSTETDADEQ